MLVLVLSQMVLAYSLLNSQNNETCGTLSLSYPVALRVSFEMIFGTDSYFVEGHCKKSIDTTRVTGLWIIHTGLTSLAPLCLV